jgi:cytochrome c-type biogenesis protein CcmH
MFQFGIFAALLLLVALSFILIPLLTARGLAKSDEEQTNILLAQNKLRELDDDLLSGNLTQEQYDSAKEELEVGLYHDLQVGGAEIVVDENKGRWLAIPLFLFVPLVALALYSIIGDPRAFDSNIATKQAQNPKEVGDKALQMNAMVEKLAQRLQKEPDDAKGWLMLGQAYKLLQRGPDAVAALRKAYELLGDQPEVMLQLADAIANNNDGSLVGEPATLINKAIALAPDNEMGLWLAGMAKAEEGDFAPAVNYWTKLQQHYKPEDQAYQELQDYIGKANARLGKPADIVTSSEQQAAATPSQQKEVKAASSVKIKVTLGDAFKGKVKSDDYVLIYAQALVGPKAPLAVVKHQVKDLPLEVTLDDSMAMIPTMTVSSVENIKVTARISATGTATPQPGEAFGAIEIKGADRAGVKSVVIADTIK